MPRRSAVDLATVPVPIPGQGRSEPPDHLDGLERTIWQEVVASLPPFWVDGAGQLVLRRLVAQAAIAERVEERLRRMRRDRVDDSEDAEDLATGHVATAKAVTFLLTALRATPRSRVISRDTGPEIKGVPAFRPWELEAEDDGAKTAQ
jgi:hypothetical protein